MAKPGTGLAEEVEDAGIVVAPGDSVALATTIVSLAQNRPLCSALGQGATTTALARWNKDTIIKGLLETFDILNGPRADQHDDAHFVPHNDPVRDGFSKR
jgi:colanic acid biosynthesis glycosyl transferase WcaI